MIDREAWEIPDSDIPDEIADAVLDEVTREMGIVPVRIDMEALRAFEAKRDLIG